MTLKRMEADMNRVSRRKVKIIEEGGNTIEDTLVNISDNKTCGRMKCQVCSFSDNKGDCRKRSVCYLNKCLICEERGTPHRYWGDSSSTLYERALQHVDEGEGCVPTSHIWQHILLHHPDGVNDIKGTFKFEVVQGYSSAFTRQLAECMLIKISKYPVMNNKLMYNRCVIPELGVTQPWKTGNEKESEETKKKQKALLRDQRKTEKLKMLNKTREDSEKRKAKVRRKKPWRRQVRFLRIKDVDGRRRYQKIIQEGNHRRKKKIS